MTAAAAPVKNGHSEERLPALPPPRLAYHPAIEERFGVTKAQWKALVEAIFPLAQSTDSIILALSYCKARNLDPFKKNIHIVPIYNGQLNRMVDTIWPGIGELRTTAFRTGQYAGRGDTIFGPDVKEKIGSVEITYPEWAQVIVKRLVDHSPVEFAGPRVYWKETYSATSRKDPSPNSMWQRRPRGQLDKCAEAAALRAAFPEELGNDHTDDEIGIQGITAPISDGTSSQPQTGVSGLENRLGLADAFQDTVEAPPQETITEDGEIISTSPSDVSDPETADLSTFNEPEKQNAYSDRKSKK